MGRKIFISYKYADTEVKPLTNSFFDDTKARDYVTNLQGLLDENDHVNKGENDDEDLSKFKEETIASKLRDKIYDSSITIVMVSRGMKEIWTSEDDQWIPWEISYSLKEHSRDGRTGKSNAVLAVVLPDRDGRYDYYIVNESCPHCKCTTLKTDFLFKIMKENMFNIKEPAFNECDNHSENNKVYLGHSSYIHSVKWSDFIADVNKHLDTATSIRAAIDDYNICKVV